MRLVDSSAWIECLIGSPLGRRLAADHPARGEWLVPTIVQLELSKWLAREMGEAKADQLIGFTETCVVAELDTAIALTAARLCRQHRLATADGIVYATSLEFGADLLTSDSQCDGLPGVTFVAKHQ